MPLLRSLFRTGLATCLTLLLFSAPASGAKRLSITRDQLRDKVLGGWAGKIIGVQYGQPYEFHYLARTKDDEIAWDADYVQGAIGQDDIYTQMSFMGTLDRYGLDASADQLADAFAHAGFMLFHANLQGRKNYFDGLRPPLTGSARYNAHADDIDFQIDADFIGFMCPGMPRTARRYCDRIGPIMNDGDGIYGGLYIATLHTLAFFDDDIPRIVETSLRNIPRKSAYARCLRDVLGQYKKDPDDWRAAWQIVHEKWEPHVCTPNHPFNIDAKMNGAYVTIGLLYGHGDLDKTIEIAIRCGQDADCNPSNAAAVWGIINGFEKLPDRYKEALAPIADVPFAYTDYSFTQATDKVMEFMETNVRRGGGHIEGDRFLIKRQPCRFRGRCVQSFPGMRYQASVDADDPAWTYTGAWNTFTEEHDNAVYHETYEPGATAEISFEGQMVTLIGAWDADGGRADVFIDGKLQRRIDSYISYRCGFSVINREVLFVASGLKPGRHTLKIAVVDEKNPDSTGNHLMFTRIDTYAKP